MDKLKQWVALALVGCLAVLAGGWFLLVGPKRAEAAELRAAKTAQEATNASLRTKLQVLAAQARDLPRQEAVLARVGKQLPSTTDLPGLVRALERTAVEHDVELVDIAPTLPAPLDAPAPGAAAPAGAAVTSGLSVVTVTLNVVGGYFPLQQFLGGLEGMTRATRVTSLALTPGANPLAPAAPGGLQDGRTLSAAVSLQVYVDGTPAASAGTPAPTAPPAAAAPAAATPPSGTTAPSAVVDN